jgi:hypothetical protein
MQETPLPLHLQPERRAKKSYYMRRRWAALRIIRDLRGESKVSA